MKKRKAVRSTDFIYAVLDKLANAVSDGPLVHPCQCRSVTVLTGPNRWAYSCAISPEFTSHKKRYT